MNKDSEPTFSLRFEERPGYLYAFVSGPVDNLEVSIALWDLVYEKAQELKMKKILLEEDFPNQLTQFEMFSIAEYVSEKFRDFQKIAHVDTHLSHADLNDFAETVATNRGLAGRVFNNMSDAKSWINQ